MNLNNIKRSFRQLMPPDNPLDAGPAYGSRLFEAAPNITPIVTYSILFLSAVLFFLTDLQNGHDAEMLKRLGHRGHFSTLIQDWWALFTAAFFHGSITHIIMNSMALFSIGTIFEKAIGSFKTLIIFLAIAFISSGFQLLVTVLPIYLDNLSVPLPHPGSFGSSLGLSGIIAGIIGFMWGAWKRWTSFLLIFNYRLLRFVVFWQILCFVLTWTGVAPIANTAHISAFIFGFFLGLWMCYGTKRGALWCGLAVATVILCIGGLFAYYIKINNAYEPYLLGLKEQGYL